ncbi:nacht nucleoside triphosphatase [Metarhizium robertsii ARSEF 23]|uniref:Nacht nucleoside triphosphatase n=1 Tax=Metarhizium robertsii (strain ARSEF 23 / ATCC MYA-3075) TaxID=655844 RepID=E9F1W3_METRA|nr:nacht nucleoside triphosphatase [Metarhizium robertsii ARSEF 23]EFY98052.2 nacht nucleoside triphosphatase [Metarhizium robertsii ARSEF 23]
MEAFQSINSKGNAEPRRLGLKEVYCGRNTDPGTPNIDIVAIHGLDTHSPKTWVAWKKDGDPKSGEVHWLQDRSMLPSVIPSARIFTYDWNANFDKDAAAQGLLGHADGLLEKLHIRRSKDAINRPLIFVASCFGGLLLSKKALHRASEGHSKYQNILKSTVGIAFLGTPFQGSNKGFITSTQLRLNIAISSGGETADELVKYLNNNDSERKQLDEVVQQFCEMANSKMFKFPIICFYETRRTDFKKVLKELTPEFRKALGKHDTGILVPEYSACLQGQPRSDLAVRHGLLNKFAGPEDPAFEIVSYYLKEFAEEALQRGPDAWIQNEHYRDKLNIVRLSGNHLSMDQCYINLAIIETSNGEADRIEKGSDGEDLTPQHSPFSILARQKVETPDKTTQVELATLFNDRKRPQSKTIKPRRILIRGRAGVGKTTLCKKIVHEFTRGAWGEWTNIFDRVLWVPLRSLKRKPDNGYHLEGLFLRDFFSNAPNREALAKQLEETLHITKFATTLFILDGLDEVSEGMRPSNEMHKFLIFLLQIPNVIITSRPNASLPSWIRAPDLELETIGFYPDQVEEYIEKTFTDFADAKTPEIDQETVDKIQLFIRDHWLLQGLIRIPIQLDALCYTWKDLDRGNLPNTMTGIYEAIVQRLWRKDIVRLERLDENYVASAQDVEIEDEVENDSARLECLAFNGLHCDIMDFTRTHRNQIAKNLPAASHLIKLSLDETLAQLSFMRTSDPSSMSEDRNYHFIHLTFQEYFAARYFVRQWKNNGQLQCLALGSKYTETMPTGPTEFLRKHKYTARYDIFWRFVAGLLDIRSNVGPGQDIQRFFRMIEDEPLDLLGPTHQRLVMHCLSEISGSVPMRENLEQRSPEWLRMREDLEQKLSEWLLFECDFKGSAQLASEMEFPERALDAALLEGSDHAQKTILQSLTGRPAIPDKILTAVAARLNDKDRYVRGAAIKALVGQRRALPDKTWILTAVLARLNDEDSYVRVAIIKALDQRPALPHEILTAVAARFNDEEWYVRQAAVIVLGGRPALPEKVLLEVVARLSDKKRDVRSAAITALGQQLALFNETWILMAVIARLKDREWYVRVAAIKVLGEQLALPKKILMIVVARLTDDNRDVRDAAVEALSRRQALPNKILTAVTAQLNNEKWYIRHAAVIVLGRQLALPNKILIAVTARLKDKEWDVRYAAVEALGGRPALPDKIFLAVAARLNDEKWDVRYAAVIALGGRPALPDEVFIAVTARLDDEDKNVRRAAIITLGGRPALPNNILTAITARINDAEGDVQQATIITLGGRPGLPYEILTIIAARLDSKNGDARRTAVEALSRQPALPNKILTIVAARLNDEDRDVRRATVVALSRQPALPDKILTVIAARLDDKDRYVRGATITALISQRPALPDKIFIAAAVRLNDKDKYIRIAVVKALGQQPVVPDEILTAVVALFSDEDEDVRRAAVNAFLDILQKHRKFNCSLLNGPQVASLYENLLYRSFEEQLSWYSEDNSSCLNMPEGIRRIYQHADIKSKINRARPRNFPSTPQQSIF